LLALIEAAPVRKLKFLDIGCSDGTTSLDTIERIERTLGLPVAGHLMDRYIWVRRLNRWPVYEYLSSEGSLVMVRVGPIALAPAPRSFLLATLTNRLVSAYLGLTTFRAGMQETARFPLLSPAVLARADLHICEGSVLTVNEVLVDLMDVVRVSNLLHTDYFSEADIRVALLNVARYVRDGGFLVISRNDEQDGGEVEQGTVWRRARNALVEVANFGGGSELKGLVG
jgi:hypothetical protein